MTTTLLLNGDFTPNRVLPIKRAIVLVLAEKAEVLEEGEEPVRAARLQMRRRGSPCGRHPRSACQ